MKHLLSLCSALFLVAAPAGAQTDPDPAQLIAQAEAGNVTAQTDLAFLYHEGGAVLQNFATAAAWAQKAAEAGDARAQNLLGQYFHTGLGGMQDAAQARHWLQAAANTGAPQFLFDYATVLEQSPPHLEEAVATYQRAVDAGHLEAAVSLGVLYQEGRGVAVDYDQARALYESAATQNHARALNNLGLLYVRGHGVDQDYEKAAALFAAAADQGLDQALTNLGVMYENGFGVALDEERAATLYRQGGQAAKAPALHYDDRLAPPVTDPAGRAALRRAADAGDPVAGFQLAWLLAEDPASDAADLSRAARLFYAAAQNGHATSMVNLALLYFEGRGVPQDYALGQMWLILAGAAQHPDAPTLSRQFAARLTPGQMADAQQMAQHQQSARR
ncbi:MAG: hypothetical protein GJ677_02320 [Rhodobacteraceae bacterium]|nr:hypothetical protein [Paracoccaceae bacterium]